MRRAITADHPALRAVCFDAAGTLFTLRRPVGTTYARIARRYGIIAAPATLERGFRRGLDTAPPLAFPRTPYRARRAREARWWRGIVDAAFAAAAIFPVPDPLFQALVAHYGRAGAWRIAPGARSLLRGLRARGMRLAVVSNFDSRIEGILEGLGLTPLLDAIAFSSAAGTAKPAPGIFRQALATLGVRPTEAVHVGDDPIADIAGARRAGLDAIWMRHGRTGRAGVPTGTPVARRLADVAVILAESRRR
jgi:putative hydrolase of the HAD superfamily